MYGYLKSDKSTEIKKEEMIKSIKEFTRPPLFNIEKDKEDNLKQIKINKKLLSHHPILSEKKLKEYGNVEDWEKFYKKAGNSGVFVCPFKECNHISDADIQASLIIGLRVWYKDKIEKIKKEEREESDEDFKNRKFIEELEYYKSMKLNPIELKFPRESFNDLMDDNKKKHIKRD